MVWAIRDRYVSVPPPPIRMLARTHGEMIDFLCVWSDPEKLIINILAFLNNLYPSIEFTVEIGGGRIKFLDLMLTIQENVYSFEIYQNPVTTDVVNHGSSAPYHINWPHSTISSIGWLPHS